MAGESRTPPRKSGLGFRVPRDDAHERLLDPLEQLDPKPKFTANISIIQFIRLVVIPLAITDTVLIGVYCNGHAGWAVFFGSWTLSLILWSAFQVIRGVSKSSQRFEFQIGQFACWCGRINSSGITTRQQRPYPVMFADFVFCVLFIILSVVAFETDIWSYNWYWDERSVQIGAISITLTALQFAVSVLNFFSLCRKSRIMIFATEHEERAESVLGVGEIYTDDQSEPRTSVASLV
ncbi:hypothetical protein EDB80DRAFT_368698 [Ilyonectria destructans]|nr:hypothetical protein EDB80DRAFT_368698 [Ilyonectria destructans]